jgi:hypothetical protein
MLPNNRQIPKLRSREAGSRSHPVATDAHFHSVMTGRLATVPIGNIRVNVLPKRLAQVKSNLESASCGTLVD